MNRVHYLRGKRYVSQDSEPGSPHGLSIRWLVIIVASIAVAILVGSAEGIHAGLLSGVVVAGSLHKITK